MIEKTVFKEIKHSQYVASLNKKQRVKKWFKDRLWWLLILTISLLTNVVFISGSDNWNSTIILLKTIFLNSKGEFQWVSVTAFVTMVSVIATVLLTMHRNQADLVSKSRIEWIQENKKTMSEYLKDAEYYAFELRLAAFARENEWPNTKDFTTESNERKVKIVKNKNLLLLNLSDNDDNQQINDCIENVERWASSLRGLTSDEIKNDANGKIVIENLMKVTRDYYKREWDKAKRGK